MRNSGIEIYLPYGELFVSQKNSSFDSRYKFTAKELDNETNYTYFGARYYDSDLSSWLSVDPLSDKYPSLSPYNYCAGNPVILVDPDGMEIDGWDFNLKTGEMSHRNTDGGDKTQHINFVNENGGVEGSVSFNTTKESIQNLKVDCLENNATKKWGWAIGGTIDATVAAGPLGYSGEVGVVTGTGGMRDYTSHGQAYGLEASVSGNFLFVVGKDFSIDKLAGDGGSYSVNIPATHISITLLTDYRHGAMGDHLFESYFGLKVGYGIGNGMSVTNSKSDTYEHFIVPWYLMK
jgi:RHS repeat-associated protein